MRRWAAVRRVRSRRPSRAVNPVRFFAESARLVGEYPGLQAAVLTLGVFWWGAAMLQMGLLVFGGVIFTLWLLFPQFRMFAMRCFQPFDLFLGKESQELEIIDDLAVFGIDEELIHLVCRSLVYV